MVKKCIIAANRPWPTDSDWHSLKRFLMAQASNIDHLPRIRYIFGVVVL